MWCDVALFGRARECVDESQQRRQDEEPADSGRAGQRRGIVQADSQQPDFFSERDLHFVSAVAGWIGMAVGAVAIFILIGRVPKLFILSLCGIALAAAKGGRADLTAMAPGVAAALITTVAGLLVAIPSMFGYNWLVHNLRVATVELDNFAQELVSRMETEYLKEEDE